MGTPVLGLYSGMATFIPEWMPHGVEFRAVETRDRSPLETLEIERVMGGLEELMERI